jgi:hypothetical protein
MCVAKELEQEVSRAAKELRNIELSSSVETRTQARIANVRKKLQEVVR